jgi:hypothetical protein
MTVKNAKRGKAAKSDSVSTLEEKVDRYESIWQQLTSFTAGIAEQEDEIAAASAEVAEAKDRFEQAKKDHAELVAARDGAKHSLFRFLHPKDGEFLPLLDRMEPADEEKHGANAAVWRNDPISALKIAPHAMIALSDAEIVVVGQLQDRVLANPDDWYLPIHGVTSVCASGVVDRLNSFIFDRAQEA